MPVAGRPETLVAAADALERTADQLGGFRRDVGDPVRRAFAGWHGTAAPIATARLGQDLDVLDRAAEACLLVAPALRTYAGQLERAQRDVADGEGMVAGAALAPGLPSAAQAQADLEMGSRILESAQEGLTFAAEDAARAVREGTSLLPEPADAEGGNLVDGLVKSGGDLVEELGATLRGALDHVNVFSDRFGAAWAETGATVAAAVTDPMGAAGAVVDGVTTPIADSYRTGGVDEAAGRGVGTIAATLLGGKGLTKLGRLVPGAPQAPSGIQPPDFTRPQTRLAPGGGLQRHDDLGGHTLDRRKAHVGATDQQLLDRQARERRPIRVSTYTRRDVAENAISENMRRNRGAIDAWLVDPARRKPEGFDLEHGRHVGRSAPVGAVLADIVDTSRSRVVLKKDPSAPGGYHILTSYPLE